MELLAWIVIGGIAGWLASLVTGKDAQLGIVGNIIVGIIGAFIGGFLLSLFGVSQDRDVFDLGTLLTAFLGAVVLLWIVGAFTKPRRS